jgi:hypothetical protein
VSQITTSRTRGLEGGAGQSETFRTGQRAPRLGPLLWAETSVITFPHEGDPPGAVASRSVNCCGCAIAS